MVTFENSVERIAVEILSGIYDGTPGGIWGGSSPDKISGDRSMLFQRFIPEWNRAIRRNTSLSYLSCLTIVLNHTFLDSEIQSVLKNRLLCFTKSSNEKSKTRVETRIEKGSIGKESNTSKYCLIVQVDRIVETYFETFL